MAGEDRTLVLELLQPFRRALGPASAPSASAAPRSPSVAAKLRFDDTTDNADFSKVKSSFDTNSTPVTKRSRIESETDASPSVVSPWQVKRFKVEALESRVQIDKLEKQISYLHVVRKEMEEVFNNERKILINERKSKDNTIADMEQKLKSMRTKEAELREQLSKGVKEFNDYKHLSEKERLCIQNEIFDLKNDLTNSKISSNEQLSKLKKEIAELSKNYEISQKEASDYQNALAEVNSDSQQLVTLQEMFDRQTVALQQAEIQLREFETSKKDLEEIKVLQKRLISMPGLEKEVVRLRDEVTELRAAARQNLLLEEQVQFYKNRMESLEPLYQNYCDLQKSHIETERILDEWKRVGDTYESPKPQNLINQIENIQQREISLLSERKDADILLSTTKTELMNTKYEHKKILSKYMDAQNIQKTQESFIHRLQKKLLLVSRERDSYRQQLDCYEKELTMNVGPESQHNLGITNNRIEGLEKSLQGYKDLVIKLEEDLSSLRGTSTQQEQLSRLRDEVINLTKENEILRLHNDKVDVQLERSICGADPGTKILHLIQNPLAKAQDDLQNTLKKAQAEITQLKHRIKLLKENELEITQRLNETLQNNGPTSEEYNQLKEQLESNKIKSQRMKEVFSSSLKDYRDVFYMLMGYSLERISANNYRISSMYADSPNQYLCFKLSDGAIEMVQTDYSASIGDLVDEHLHQHRSFPVFLSELTLDLFKRTTMISNSMTESFILRLWAKINDSGLTVGVRPWNMTQPETLDLVHVHSLFQASLHENDDINILKYIDGYKELIKFFNILGTVFSFVSSDVKSKIKIMEKHAQSENAQNYQTFRKMMDFEKDTGLYEKNGFVSGSRTLLRLHRGLDFIRLFLKDLQNSDAMANTCTVCQNAYSNSLAQYHPWYIKQGAMLAMHALPAREDLLKKIFGNEENLRDALLILPDMLKSCDEVYMRVEMSYTDFDFHGLP